MRIRRRILRPVKPCKHKNMCFMIHEILKYENIFILMEKMGKQYSQTQGFSLGSAIGHSPKIVPDVREFAVQFGQFVRDDFRKRTLYGYAQ